MSRNASDFAEYLVNRLLVYSVATVRVTAVVVGVVSLVLIAVLVMASLFGG